MKKFISFFLTFIFISAALNCTLAQRGDSRGSSGRDKGNANVSAQRNERDYSSNRTSRNIAPETRNVREPNITNSNRMPAIREEDRRQNSISTSTINRNEQRNEVASQENRDRSRYSSSNVFERRNYTPNNQYRTPYTRNTVYNNYYNNNYHSRYYPHVFMSGPRYTVLPRSFISINFGGFPYYYNDGLFYGSYGGYYQPLFPPVGIHIGILPFGYRRIFIGANLFYYYNGIYYRQYRDQNTYEVVDAPMGATVSSLPNGAKSVVLNGEKLYELNGTYYRQDSNFKGQTVYTVVGKNGEVNNTDNNTPPASLNAGDVISQLPEGSKIVTINGEQLYVTPDDTYLKEQSDGNSVQYKVVGK